MTVRASEARWIRDQIEALLAHGAAVQTDGDPDSIHDMRVASRRLRECLRLFRDSLPRKVLRKAQRQLRRITQGLGLPREWDVHADRLRELAAACAPAETQRERAAEPDEGSRTADEWRVRMRVALDVAHMRVAQQRDRLREDLHAEIATWRLDRLAATLREVADAARIPHVRAAEQAEDAAAKQVHAAKAAQACAKDAESDVHRAADADGWTREWVAGQLAARAEAAFAPLQAHIAAEDPEAMHDPRKCVKRLRYAIELLEPWFQRDHAKLRKRAKQVQDILGDHHDWFVMSQMIETWQAEAEAWQAAELAAGLHEVAKAARAQQASCYQQFLQRARSLDVQAEQAALRAALQPSATTATSATSASQSRSAAQSSGATFFGVGAAGGDAAGAAGQDAAASSDPGTVAPTSTSAATPPDASSEPDGATSDGATSEASPAVQRSPRTPKRSGRTWGSARHRAADLP